MRSIICTGFGLLLTVLLANVSPAGEVPRQALRIGDGRRWTFVNSRWKDTADGGIAGERIGDGEGLQGYCLAFQKDQAFADLEATFTIRMDTAHADEGLIVRAQDPTRFTLIHFPQTGQQYRAQHFWIALSVADGSGYLRVKHLQMVRRVASNPFGIAHRAKVRITGNRYQVWINDHPALDVRDETHSRGRVGLSGFTKFSHGKVALAGDSVPAEPWDEQRPQVQNWFTPFPDAGPGQFVSSLTRAPNGDLVCLFATQGDRLFKNTRAHLGRSRDGGKTWTVEPAPRLQRDGLPGGASIFTLPDGRLASLSLTHGKGVWCDSKDNGHTWSPPLAIQPDKPWPSDPRSIVTGFQFPLRDGTLIRFALGGHSTSSEPVTKWGAVHCQAFSTRSTDGGRTWSSPVNLDGDRRDMGNLDLTELRAKALN